MMCDVKISLLDINANKIFPSHFNPFYYSILQPSIVSPWMGSISHTYSIYIYVCSLVCTLNPTYIIKIKSSTSAFEVESYPWSREAQYPHCFYSVSRNVHDVYAFLPFQWQASASICKLFVVCITPSLTSSCERSPVNVERCILP